MMGLGTSLLTFLSPVLEFLAPYLPGDTFPLYFEWEMFQRALLAALLISIVAGLYGTFLMLRNLALIGDGLAHVSFGGMAVGVALGSVTPLNTALLFSIIAAIIIYELQSREILTGDTSIAIFLTGTLAFGLVVLSKWGDGITTDIEAYLFGSLNMIDPASLDMITLLSLFSLVSIAVLHRGLLAMTIDSVAARVQGIPVNFIGLWFSITIAIIVVSMVKLVGVLLVSALLVTPAATAQIVSRSFRGCMLWAQAFGLSATFLGIYFAAELNTGTGAMIAVVAATQFALLGLIKTFSVQIRRYVESKNQST
tara:strand:+ start:1525 stop:2454 length:930 start_codon:yes stop_codon:yes gene_type:complete